MNNGTLLFAAAGVYDDRPQVVEASYFVATSTLVFIGFVIIIFIISYYVNKNFNNIDYWTEAGKNTEDEE